MTEDPFKEFGMHGELKKEKIEKIVYKQADPRFLNQKESPEERKQTYDILGKHIYDFMRFGSDEDEEECLIPEIFLVLVSYFEINEHLYKTEALFRKAG